MAPRINEYLDPGRCPGEKPSLDEMAVATRELHEGVDAAIRRAGVAYLHPESPTINLDLLGSARMTTWQESKASYVFEGTSCWSELNPVYARYGAEPTRKLLAEVRQLEKAPGAVLTDCGMQACALLFDVLVRPDTHAVLMRQVYNKTRKYLERVCERVKARWTIVDDGDQDALDAAVQLETVLVFAETFSNPLTRAVNPAQLGAWAVRTRKERAPRLRLVLDHTIASPWALKRRPLEQEGIDFVVASGTKSLGGQDRDLWGYVASGDADVLNEVMDLQAMRGGILDWRRASAILAGLPAARTAWERRCQSAAKIAAFLARHPVVGEVFHPSLPTHPDRACIQEHYDFFGSLLSLRLAEGDEADAKHFADVLATCGVLRYALSFDGPTTKVNHHRTVSEYFTPAEEIARMGIEGIIRLGIGIEEPDDIMACLNWALWNFRSVSPQEVRRWQQDRSEELGLPTT